MESIVFNFKNIIQDSSTGYLVAFTCLFCLIVYSFFRQKGDIPLLTSEDISDINLKLLDEKTRLYSLKQDTPLAKPLIHLNPISETPNIDVDCFAHFKGTRLLLVEDNLINQKILLSVLKKSGIIIEIANNGQEALNILFKEEKYFDLVLMDISMPIMDGFITTQYIRNDEKFDRMPIVTFTAFAMGTEIQKMFDIGCNAYLTKPLNVKKLYTVFAIYLSNIRRDVPLYKAKEIEGLDIQYGITWADNNELLYKETLREFIRKYHDMAELVPKWIKEKKYDRLRSACIEMKRMLDIVGAYEMKALVDEMQKHFVYKNQHLLEKYIFHYPLKFNILIETMQEYLEEDI